MIFYICLAVALLFFGMGIYFGKAIAETVMGAIAGVIIGLVVAAIASAVLLATVMSISIAVIPQEKTFTGETTVNIRALDSDSGMEGKFYLRTGYIEEKRVLDYISEEDGVMKLGRVPADSAILRESDEAPALIVRNYEMTNGWIVPGAISVVQEYEFIIPEGSVKEGFAVQ